MAILNNTSIVLGIHEPKKNAVVAQPGIPPANDEMRIWAAASVDENLTQSIIGDFIKLFRMAKTELARLTGPIAILHMPIGGSDNDITIDGTPTADEIRLEIGVDVLNGDRSHFLDRTFKRLLERWLEESK